MKKKNATIGRKRDAPHELSALGRVAWLSMSYPGRASRSPCSMFVYTSDFTLTYGAETQRCKMATIDERAGGFGDCERMHHVNEMRSNAVLQALGISFPCCVSASRSVVT